MLSLLLLLTGLSQCVVIPQHWYQPPHVSWKTVVKKEGHADRANICPGGTQCPQFATCCVMQSGDWGCCPFPQAVCCTDRLHCCPKDNTCDLAQQRCTTGLEDGSGMPWMEKFVWNSSNNWSVGSITCPDRQSECPDQTTCCQMASGDWGCCPFEGAQCCSDKLHCCPKETVCNLTEQRCQKKTHSSLLRKKWMYQIHAIADKSWNTTENVCPDHHSCGDDTTCCRMKSGKYGCCAFPEADCCSDGLHCCPKGSKCDVKAGKCT